MKNVLYYCVYLWVRLVGMLPFRFLYFCGWFLGQIYYRLAKRDRYITMRNIQTCLAHMPTSAQQKIAKESMVNTVINVFETLWLWAHDYQQVHKIIRGYQNLPLLQRCEADNKGTVILAGHLGNWEILTDVVAYHCQRPIYLGKLSGIKIFDDYIKRGREQSGGELLSTTRGGLEQLIAANAAGRVTGLLCDQTPSPKYGIYAPFFGKTALTSVFAQKLVAQTGANVILAWAERLGRGRGFVIKFDVVDADFFNPDLQLATNALNRSYQKMILSAPAQYIWNYRRFSHMPEGEQVY